MKENGGVALRAERDMELKKKKKKLPISIYILLKNYQPRDMEFKCYGNDHNICIKNINYK